MLCGSARRSCPQPKRPFRASRGAVPGGCWKPSAVGAAALDALSDREGHLVGGGSTRARARVRRLLRERRMGAPRARTTAARVDDAPHWRRRRYAHRVRLRRGAAAHARRAESRAGRARVSRPFARPIVAVAYPVARTLRPAVWTWIASVSWPRSP